MIITLLVTPHGKKAMEYVLHFCFKERNRRLARRLSDDLYSKVSQYKRKELVLKTTLFESFSSHDSDESRAKENEKKSTISDDNPTCSICIGEVEYGDKIGVLTCKHIFHADCLKCWIKRSNVCPLCMSPEIATTRVRNGSMICNNANEV